MDNKQMPQFPENNNSAGNSAELPLKDFKLPKVEIETPESKVSTDVKIPFTPKNGIDVVATRNGFYNQTRLKKGDKFKLSSIDHLGEWMVCVDPVMETERIKKIDKKKNRNTLRKGE